MKHTPYILIGLLLVFGLAGCEDPMSESIVDEPDEPAPSNGSPAALGSSWAFQMFCEDPLGAFARGVVNRGTVDFTHAEAEAAGYGCQGSWKMESLEDGARRLILTEGIFPDLAIEVIMQPKGSVNVYTSPSWANADQGGIIIYREWGLDFEYQCTSRPPERREREYYWLEQRVDYTNRHGAACRDDNLAIGFPE